MTEKDLKIRTKKFAVDVLNFIDKMPNRRSGNIISGQLGRSASSVAAKYRAACGGRSHAEFVAKPGIVEEEADESTFWLDIIPSTKNGNQEEVDPLLKESRENLQLYLLQPPKPPNKTKENKDRGQFPISHFYFSKSFACQSIKK